MNEGPLPCSFFDNPQSSWMSQLIFLTTLGSWKHCRQGLQYQLGVVLCYFLLFPYASPGNLYCSVVTTFCGSRFADSQLVFPSINTDLITLTWRQILPRQCCRVCPCRPSNTIIPDIGERKAFSPGEECLIFSVKGIFLTFLFHSITSMSLREPEMRVTMY